MSEQTLRSEMLLGSDALARLRRSRVAVLGLGGVGSWCAEALARAGVGALTLVDEDTVSESNINRQCCALHSTIGLPKAEVMAARVRDINPGIAADARTERYEAATRERFFDTEYDYIADCIDLVSCKVDLIRTAHARGIPIVSALGTGNKADASRFELCDISRTSGCPLARVMRRELRSAGITHHAVVFSPAPALTPEAAHGAEDRARSVRGTGGADMKSVWIVLLCLLGAAVLTALLVWYLEQRMLARSLGRAPERADAQAAWEQHMLRKQGWTADSEPGSAALARARAGLAAIQERPHEDVFTPGLDGARLHARLYRVPNAHATVILCHGYHSRAEHDFGAQFPALYASGGCNLLLIDERAHGLSEGKCLTFGQLERYDIAQWVHWVREHSRVQRPIALYGVSMGAASVLLAAQLPELRGELACGVADCGYSSFELEVTDAVHHATNAPCWLQGPLARACVRILRRNGLDFDAVDTTPGMAALDIPILFFHGDADTFVPLHHSERNLAACRREQRLIVIPGAEHAMSAQVDPERYRHPEAESEKEHRQVLFFAPENLLCLTISEIYLTL